MSTPTSDTAFRFRISTVLMVLALLGSPLAVFWISAPNPFTEGTTAWRAWSWLFLDMSPLLFVLVLPGALVGTVVDAFSGRWSSVPQCLTGMLVCFNCGMAIPVS